MDPGAGFIGGNFVYHQCLHHPEDKVICIGRRLCGNLTTLKEHGEMRVFRL